MMWINYNKRNKQIIQQNQEEKGEILSENIPEDILKKARVSIGGDYMD
jgi:hypothetical protein